MKLDCEVTAVMGDGENLTVRLQGSASNDAAWRRMGTQELTIAETPRSQKTFHLGRRVQITIKAK